MLLFANRNVKEVLRDPINLLFGLGLPLVLLAAFSHLAIVLGYAVVMFVIAVVAFKRKMNGGSV